MNPITPFDPRLTWIIQATLSLRRNTSTITLLQALRIPCFCIAYSLRHLSFLCPSFSNLALKYLSPHLYHLLLCFIVKYLGRRIMPGAGFKERQIMI